MSGARFHHRVAGAVLAAGIVVQLSCAVATAAAQGVALDTGRIAIETPLAAGKTYQVARIAVRNPGTLRTRYDLIVTPIDTSAHTPPAAWFSFSPKQVTLRGGKQQVVTISLRVPKTASAGRYEVLVGARVAPSGDGMSIGAAAAARVTFSVAPWGAAQPLIEVVETWWPVPVGAVALAGILLRRTRRQTPGPG